MRHAKLKELKREYEDLLDERRARLRKSNEIIGGADPAAIMERKEASMEFRRTLRSQFLNLELELAEAEALLARRKESAGSATDAVRKEIAQIEDRIAGMKARQKVLDQWLKEANASTSINDRPTLDLEPLKAEVATLERVFKRIADEAEQMNVEIQAPPRVRSIEDAVIPTTPFRAGWWGSLASNGS
jgi:chromosome segregation ATPase